MLRLVRIVLLLSLAAGAVALDAKAEDYTPDEAAQEEQEQAPSIDTSSYVQVADPALYAKLDTLQESIDRLADALTPADAETDAEAPTEEQPAPDYTAQLSGISAQLADMAQQATAETAEDGRTVGADEQPQLQGQFQRLFPQYAAVLPPLPHQLLRQCPAIPACGQTPARRDPHGDSVP